MKTLVTYYSQTGNTKKVAEAIFGEIEGPKEIIPIGQVASVDQYDVIFVGSPIEQHGLVKMVRSFLQDGGRGKKIALFITHAAPEHSEMAASYVSRCKSLVSESSELIGFFNCQGELSESLAKRMLNSGNAQLRRFAEMRILTLRQPDEQRIENSRQFAREMNEKINACLAGKLVA
ncbi:MAG: flavodoxin family protein [Candidatus Thorarchaeota archaeon]